jgi:dipeptidyl aminopeptidase/acylaminoacyl peptidase
VAARAACEDLLPIPRAGREKARLVTPDDLLALRDVGYPDAALAGPESPLAVSPDGKRIAFVITRADKSTNAYCRGLAVLDLEAGGAPMLVDRGGEFVPLVVPNRGLLVNVGAADIVTPVWSPDGRSLAYRKRVDGRTEAWIAAADGGGARRLARLEVDVEALAWSGDGLRVVTASQPGYARQARALEEEGASGFLYDDRFQPNDASRPALLAESDVFVQAIDLASGTIAQAGDADRQRLPADYAVGLPAALSALGPAGRRAQLMAETNLLVGSMRVHAESAERRMISCSADACQGSIEALFWVGDAVVFLRREGWANGTSALYRWIPGEGGPRRLFSTEDAVLGCVPAARGIVCLAENAATPRRIVRVDPAGGARHTLFDPNPEFRAVRFGEVRRLRIRNMFGLEAWADLVLPPDYHGGRLPLVVVQYYSRGFLRGGGGDEYPIHASAARGIAVLSIQRPRPVALFDPGSTTNVGLTAGGTRAWAERRSLLSVIEQGVAEAVRLGVADPSRIGITGQSDGATSSIFAIINCKTFAAAAITSSALEPNTTMIYGGPRWAEFNRAIGYPELGKADPKFWAPMSLAQNASRLSTPVLIEAADHEYLLSLEMWAHLRQVHYPIEMFVFPGEYHNKWQPAHRFAVYTRNLDWFAYWLAGRREGDPAKAGQYRRWDELSRQRDAKAKEVPAP